MSIYKKLQQARTRLQAMPLKKSGNNKFAGYQYFELGDFLPQSIEIFNELGLCDVISFTADTATMRIIDIETEKEIVITSPMGSASLKGCHEVQNVGAVETYQRRYLWVTAMGIVEHDAIDATTSNEAPTKQSQKSPEPAMLTKDQIAKVQAAADAVGMTTQQICEIGKVASLAMIKADSFAGLIKWINSQKKEVAA